jgi:hypothetical protein
VTTATKASPARRARARRAPATALPPTPHRTRTRRDVDDLQVLVGGRSYVVGPSVQDDPRMTWSLDGAAGLELTVLDERGRLLALLSDQADTLQVGVSVDVDGARYVLRAVSAEGRLVTLTLEDEVANRLRRFWRFVAVRRTRTHGFPYFAKRLVDEASRAPYTRIPFFCPQLGDAISIPKPKAAGTAGRSSGTGATTVYTVKGHRATARQRTVIDGILTEADRLGASRRVMVACIMTATQESTMGADQHQTGNDDVGIYQQGRNWIDVAGARDPARSTRAFLLGGPAFGRSAPGWKQRHKNLKSVPRGYEAAIKKVQVSVGGYARWQKEAERTVTAWTGGGESQTRVVVEPYEFTRGEKRGQTETSWDCLGRYAEERRWHRWASQNWLWLVSDDELRGAAPSLELDGDEGWLLEEPSFEWSPRRPVAELTLSVATQRWGMQLGAVVSVPSGARSGRWLVSEVEGTMLSPELKVTLRRPVAAAREPAPETSTVTVRGGGGADVATVRSAARAISAKHYPYVWGGGHRRCGTPDRGTGRDAWKGIGYDCSGYVAACLAAAGHGFHYGQSVPSSGTMASSWGRAGRGRDYTVWANSEHVWIEFHDGSRADTSPHGSGGSGARYRTGHRFDQSRFRARHWPGN